MTPSRPLPLSVCICTRNRAASLRRALESLARQRHEGDWEILLVDNGSTDDTRIVAAELARCLPLRYTWEPLPGLSRGRNRALSEAAGNLLVFTDDDIEFDEGWLDSYVRAAESFSDVDFFGGRILPKWSSAPPRWLHDDRLELIAGLLGHYDQGNEVRLLAADEPLPFGASFALRRRLIEVVGAFRLDLGVRDSVPGRGEETDYMLRAIECGARGVYVGDAVCRHHVDPARLRLPHLFRYGFHKGREVHDLGGDGRASGSVLVAIAFLGRGARQLLLGRGDRFRQCVINSGIQIGLLRAR
jgi:glycosyltransferase involved in cell wall biosynthesis